MLVIKRNKSVENFDWKKVEKVIVKAFNAVNEPINQATLNEIRDELSFNSITSVEEIQDQIEYALMTLDYCNVAKAFILYRNKQTENRVLDQKVKFIHDYTNASNAATGSRFDPNANVTEKNVATLTAELYKGDIIKLNRARLADNAILCGNYYVSISFKWFTGFRRIICKTKESRFLLRNIY